MSDDEKQPIIVIKRIKKIKHSGHHGGSWKIAYADFVTAMMCFFMLMWILSLLNKSQLESVAEYFKDTNKHGLVKEGSPVNKDKQEDFFLEKGNEKGKWKDIDKKKEDFKEKTKSEPTKDDPKKGEGKADDIKKLTALKEELEKKIDLNPVLSQYKNQLNFVITSEGLKIELHDLKDKPMFTTGKSDFENYAQTIVSWLGTELNTYPNQVMVIGHTDSAKFKSDGYTNWELSSDRANATRRILIKYGMEPEKILRVVGVADHDPFDKDNGLNPSNRRIEIIVLTDEAVKKMYGK